MKIKAITTEKEFDSVKDEWMNFEKKVDNKNITSSYLWQRTWWKHFGHIDNNQYGYGKKLSIIFLYNDKNELRAIAPFCIVKRKLKKIFNYTIIEFIAQQWGATYLDFISNDILKNEIDYIFEWLKKNRKFDLIHLRYIPEFTNNFDLENENATVLSACPEINLSEFKDYEDYNKNIYNSKTRNKLKARYKKLNENLYDIKIVEFRQIDSQLIQQIIRVTETKKIDGKHNVFGKKIVVKFFKDIFKITNGYMLGIFIYDKLAAYQLSSIYNNMRFYFALSYDRNYRNLGLGNLINDQEIINTNFNDVNKICMGTGIDYYKLKFTKQVCKIYNVLYKGNTLKSSLIYRKKLSANKIQETSFLQELNEKLPQEKLR